MIHKGKITSIVGPADRNGDPTRARVMPCTGEGAETSPLTVPWWLRGNMGNLSAEVEVVYTEFEDTTGVILSRMDGEWPGVVPGAVTVDGIITADDLTTSSVSSQNAHVHGGVMAGSGKTSKPE